LVAALRRGGHDVIALVRRDAGPEEAHWEPASGSIDADAIEGADAAVHLAGAGIGDRRWTAGRRKTLVASRVASTELLARTMAGVDRPPRVLVSASAVGFYGNRGDEELTEESPPGDDFLAELCVKWEAATEAAERAGVRVVRWRSGVVLATDGGALARMLPQFRLGLGGVLGSGRQWLSWISLRDEVQGMLYALEQVELRGPVNGCAPNPVTNREFTRALGQVVHRPTLVRVPRAALGVVLGRDVADQVALASQRVLPGRLLAAGYQFAHPIVSDALRAVVDGGG
jgi:hypothetical protein